MDRQINVEIKDRVGWTKEFNELTELFSFLESEAGHWKKVHGAIKKSGVNVHELIECFSTIDGAITDIKRHIDNSNLSDSDFNKYTKSTISRLKENWLCSDNSCSAVFIDCNKQHGMHAANAFIKFIVERKTEHIHDYEHFIGILAAYEFVYQDSEVLNRKAKIQELEDIYQEKLRMAKPAEYWNNAAKKFRLEGIICAGLLVISLLLGAVYLSNFFTDWLMGQELQVKLNTVQGIVIFGTLLAVYGILIRVLSRLAFSAFHLMRDAEEREQLTYLYLSLINEKKIDEKSRDIILQALFSRSETGLLTGESAPTMPGVGMSEIVNPKQS